MRDHGQMERTIQAVLEREPRVNPHRSPISVRHLENSTYLLAGDVASIEEKRVAVMRAGATEGVEKIIDHLRVRPSSHFEDGAIRDLLFRQLSEEPVFSRSALGCRIEGDADALALQPDDADNRIDASVIDGVITLRGYVLSLSHRRFAAVLAWWIPGCRDVVNELEIRPPEDDNDDELNDGIQLVLEKDPVLRTHAISVQVRDATVTLRGSVATEEGKRMAARNAWYVEGVRDVINELAVERTSTSAPRR